MRIFSSEYEDNKYEVNLFNVKSLKRFLMAQMYDSRQHHNQFRMFNDKDSIEIYTSPSDEMIDLINKENIINNLSGVKYEIYRKYLSEFNDYYLRIR